MFYFFRRSVFLCSCHQFRDVIRINIETGRLSLSLWIVSTAVGRNIQIIRTLKFFFIKYSMLFHHYSNYHMLRSRSQQIQNFGIRKYSSPYTVDDENSLCSLVLKQWRILKVCFGRCIPKSILCINGPFISVFIWDPIESVWMNWTRQWICARGRKRNNKTEWEIEIQI